MFGKRSFAGFPVWLMILATALIGAVAGQARAQQQFRIHTWESFESGSLPENLVRYHMGNESTVQVVDYLATNFPPSVTAGVAGLQCGRYGVLWRPSEEARHLSFFGPDGLDRSKLGQTGCALYQADIYFPDEGVPMPNVSLLAQVIGGESQYNFYRFGILEPGDFVFFSMANGKSKPDIYVNQKVAELNIKRPGWHRFQIVFRGASEIYCAVDGQVTSFSPQNDTTHQNLNCGLMVTRSAMDAVALTDNLSIQWTPTDAPLPISPWTQALPSDTVANRTPLETGSSVIWTSDPQQAWALASRQKRPLLILFFIPEIGPYRYLRSIVPNNDTTHQLFNQYVLLQVDANQLYGGRLAEKFQIFRLPTFVVLGPDGKESKRVTVVSRQTTWEELEREILRPPSPAAAPAPDAPVEAAPETTANAGP